MYFDNYFVENGLSQNTVTHILKDASGFMWFGTHEGLVRFDGSNFLSFRHKINDMNSLSSNSVRALTGVGAERIWIGTYGGGLNLFEQKTGTFKHFMHDSQNADSLTDDRVNELFIDSQQRLWIGTSSGGLNLLVESNGRFKFKPYRSKDYEGLLTDSVWSIAEDSYGNIWVGTDGGGVSVLDPKTDVFTSYTSNPDDPNSISDDRVKIIYKDVTGTMWLGTVGGGLNRYNYESHTFSHYSQSSDTSISLSHNNVNAIMEDQSHRLWVGTDDGINIFDPNKETIRWVKRWNADQGNLSNNRVMSLFEDEQGIVWVGTFNGLNKWNSHQVFFNHVSMDVEHAQKGKLITQFAEQNDGSILVGSHGAGVTIFDKRKAEFVTLSDHHLLKNAQVMSLLIDRKENIWIGTRSSGLKIYSPETQSVTHFYHDPEQPNSIINDNIYSMLESKNGDIWISSYKGGLNWLKNGEPPFIHFQNHPSDATSLCSNRILDLYEDSDGNLWLATESGIGRFDKNQHKFSCFQSDKNSSSSLSSNITITIFEDSRGNFWIGTYGGGVNIWLKEDRKALKKKFKTITTDDGLLSNNIYSVLEDDSGQIWLSSNMGISRLNPDTMDIQWYTPTDGLQGYDYFFSSALKTQDGELMFGGSKGFNLFDPKMVSTKLAPPKVVLTDILKLNKPSNGYPSFNTLDNVSFDYTDYLVTFDFIGLNYLDAQKNRYRYKLEGFDDNWIESGTHHRATYTNVPAGQYVFKVKSSLNGQQWSQEFINLQVEFRSAIWATWWAYCLYCLFGVSLFLFLTWLIYQRKLAEKGRQAALAIATAKDNLLANISHEFRTPLTLISGPLSSIRREVSNEGVREKIDMVLRNANRLLVMVEQTLELMRLRESKNNQRHLKNIVETAQFVIESFQSLAEEKDIQLTLDLRDHPEMLVWMAEDALEKILINLVSNALKYTQKGGCIDVSISLHGDSYVKLKVTDNGCGISEQDLPVIFDRFTRLNETRYEVIGSGIGLALVKELTDSNNGIIEVFSEPGIGSKFIIRLPLAKESGVTQDVLSKSTQGYINDVIGTHKSDNLEDILIHTQPGQTDGESKSWVLIIEDNTDLQRFLINTLEHYQCIIANDGEEGVAKAKEYVPDIIISDVMMPKMDGFQVAQVLKQDVTTSHIPIVMLTAKGDKNSRLYGWQNKVDEYLSKPFDPKELLYRIENLLAIRELLRNHFYQKSQSSQSRLAFTEDCVANAVERDSEGEWGELEQIFIERFIQYLKENFKDSTLKVTDIAYGMHVSERQLTRKLKALMNITPADYLRNYRLEVAADLLRKGRNISEIAFEVGFSSHSNFTRCFKAKYGYPPSSRKRRSRKIVDSTSEGQAV